MTWMRKKYHAMTIEEAASDVHASLHGLSEAEAHKRLLLFGPNSLENEEVSLLTIFLRQLNNPPIIVLLLASVISIFLQEVVDFFVIFGVVMINSLVGFWQELKAASSLAELRKMTATKNIVVRGGKVRVIPSSELVPGDCIVFHPGEVVTADARLIESSGIMVNEATITGESMPVVKQYDHVLPESALPYEWSNMALTGSTIVRGTGRGIVVSTGHSTYLASIGARAQEPSPETPLQISLKAFTKQYMAIILVILGILGGVGLAQQRPALELTYLLLASLVSAVPEGLPIVVTLCMVYGTILLRRKQTLVRDLPSIETLGSATVIASDKTGTITEGKLVVKETFQTELEDLQRIAVLCNDSQEGVGDPLDVALIDWVERAQELRERYPRKWILPFDANLMLMATINEVDKVKTLYVKGAYESLKEKVADHRQIKEFDKVFSKFLHHGYRVLAFAEGKAVSKKPEEWELVLKGLIGFIDPPKEGVHHAVSCVKKAGIHVIMITGDHPVTAQMVGHEVGIWKENDQVLTGREIEQMPADDLVRRLLHTTVLARILPEHKYKVVKVLQSAQEIVAVTGDGVNDIPALKAANIGVAMGSGAEAAKNVSRMILVDNNFTVLVNAIRYARLTAANIRKVIYYLVSTSLQEIVLLSCSIFFALPSPLTPIQILWLNLVTAGVMDKTFSLIAEEGDLMAKKPTKAGKSFFDIRQIHKILFFGITQGVFCFVLYWKLFDVFPFQTVSTIVFTSVVVSEWANGLQAQKEDEPFFYNVVNSFTINPFIYLAFLIGVILQLSVTYLFPSLFSLTPLSLDLWIFPAMSFVFAFGAVEVRKWVLWLWNGGAPHAPSSSHRKTST